MNNTKNLQFEGISFNGSYLFTNNGVVNISEDLNGQNILEYSNENLNIAVNILKENFNFLYKNSKVSLDEYLTIPRKFLNVLLEDINHPNIVTVVNEWERKYGNKLLLINESFDNLIIESRVNNSWNAINLIIEDFWSDTWVGRGLKSVGKGISSAASAVKKGVSNTWDWVKNKVTAAYNCLTNDTVACLMENFRSFAYSAVGVGITTAIEVGLPGIGNIPNTIIYGSLLIWDIYKWYSGKYTSGEYKFEFSDIIFDILGIAFPLLIKAIGNKIKAIGSFFGLGKAAAQKGGIFAKIFNGIKSGVSAVINAIKNAASWLGNKLGIKFLANFGTKAESQLSKFVDDMDNGAKSVTKGKVIKAGVKSFVVTSAVCQALGLNWNCKEKDVQQAINTGKITEKDYQEALKSVENNSDINWDEAEFEL
jgi:hypothetical protein